ncbi:GGDEF domain-containing protein [Mycolicibacterium sp. CH28]|uniref:GGDEF domain-containing protein n=1 Tax=Mycolicibacterium sp. CH28 TaxID=2512237 RepID=UPI00107FEB9E|nr:GGDEF domain-containing protein [Mycolicibacterium sp. CH28]TGD86283.1 GGDEF domain-containing protein [Mycolicibacterium sp. CH28]
MIPDVRTMWMVVATTASLFGFLEVWAGYGKRRDTAMILWGCANLAGGIGAGLLSTQGIGPYVLAEAAANGFLVLVWAMIWAGVRAFAGWPIPWLTALSVPLAVVFACLYVPPLSADMVMRVHVTSLGIVIYLVLIAIDSLRAERTERLVTRRVLAVLAIVSIVPVVWRTIIAQMQNETFQLMENSPATSAPLVGLFVMAIAINVCLLLIGRERLSNQLARAAVVDSLTDTFNRSGFLAKAQEVANENRQAGMPVSIVVMDLDDFKAVNDRHGHAAGDVLLAGFAAVARSVLRADDVMGRIGGEEFCALLAGADKVEATGIAVRLCLAFAQSEFSYADGTLTGTVSVGGTRLRAVEELASAMERADRAMYQAKRDGRDRVVWASE